MKQIIFFTYESDDPSISHGYEETHDLISNRTENVKTTQMALLSMELFDFYGYDEIIIHEKDSHIIKMTYDRENNKISCDNTMKELRLAHNIEKMWKAGAFSG